MDSDEAQAPGDERRRLLEQLPPSTPVTLERAAYLANYRSSSTLPRNVLTTAGALLSYLGTLHNKGAARGRPRRKPSGIVGGEAGE